MLSVTQIKILIFNLKKSDSNIYLPSKYMHPNEVINLPLEDIPACSHLFSYWATVNSTFLILRTRSEKIKNGLSQAVTGDA